jgi:hypothetical protein
LSKPRHESVSHIQIRHAYDFSLCFLHELLMSFLKPITTRRLGELVTMDIVEYQLSHRGHRYCLVMIDHFTK